MDSKQILSVGIDIGTSTSQLVFSRLELRNRAAACQIPRFEITDRRILWQSPVAFTPLTDVDTLDEAALDALLAERHTTRKKVLLLLYNGKRSVLIQKKTAPEGTV